MRAIGFHGTSAEAARRILLSGFEIGRNEYDWLGDGACFFQDSPARSLEWARQRFGDKAAVVGAEIDLEDCIDFLDVEWQEAVKEAYERYRALLAQEGRSLPRQTRGAHRLDRSDQLPGCPWVGSGHRREVRPRGVRGRCAGVPGFRHARPLTRPDRRPRFDGGPAHLAPGLKGGS